MEKKSANDENSCAGKRFNTGGTTDLPESRPGPNGLCVNCDNAEACKLAGFGEAVFFCEEHTANPGGAGQVGRAPVVIYTAPNLKAKKLLPGWKT